VSQAKAVEYAKRYFMIHMELKMWNKLFTAAFDKIIFGINTKRTNKNNRVIRVAILGAEKFFQYLSDYCYAIFLAMFD